MPNVFGIKTILKIKQNKKLNLAVDSKNVM